MIIAVFLCEFNVKSGYTLLWSESIDKFDFKGLEYKSFPSGVHDFNDSVTFISQEYNGEIYNGLSVFHQEGESHDRSDVKMQSLGILCDQGQGFEYIDDLKKGLYQDLLGKPTSPHEFQDKLPILIKHLGPLIFPVFKQCLLNKRILLFNKLQGEDPFLEAGVYTNLLSLLSGLNSIYQIGLNDIDHLPQTYIASTTDEIIKDMGNYDIGIDLSGPAVFDKNHRNILATHQDFEHFIQICPGQVPDKYQTYVEPDTWAMSIWSAFSWFASAGQIITAPEITNIVDYFHTLTRKWKFILHELVEESDGNLEITYQDFIDLELDYRLDQSFLLEFINLHWPDVKVTFNINSCC